MGASVSTQDIALVICLSVVFALTALFSGYLAYLCTRDPDRIRRRFARFYIDSQLSDAFIQKRLFSRYLGSAILCAIASIVIPLDLFGIPLYWLLAVGLVIYCVIVLENW